MPDAKIFENLEAGSDIDEIVEQFHVTREQVQAALEFAPAASMPRHFPTTRPLRLMRILFDHGTPSGLSRSLASHEVTETIERRWNRISNGELLTKAEAEGFELLPTTSRI